jgi:allophanate hydrolase subunit 2
VQVPGGVEPIVLLQDAVTGGGYATLGTVVSVDRDRLAQTKTGDHTRFVPVDLDEALTIRRDRATQLDRVRGALA